MGSIAEQSLEDGFVTTRREYRFPTAVTSTDCGLEIGEPADVQALLDWETGEVVVLEPDPEPDPNQPRIWLGDCSDRGYRQLLEGQTVEGAICVFTQKTSPYTKNKAKNNCHKKISPLS